MALVHQRLRWLESEGGQESEGVIPMLCNKATDLAPLRLGSPTLPRWHWEFDY